MADRLLLKTSVCQTSDLYVRPLFRNQTNPQARSSLGRMDAFVLLLMLTREKHDP